MDAFASRKVVKRTDSDGLLAKGLVNPRVSHSKRWMEVMKGESGKRSEIVENGFLNTDGMKAAEIAVVKELEIKLGFCLVKESLTKLADQLKEKLRYIVVCSVLELQEFHKKIQKVLDRVESFGDSEWKITLGDQEFLFKVQDRGWGASETHNTHKSTQKLNATLDLPETKLDLCKDYEEKMIEAFEALQNKSISSKVFKKLTKKSEFLIQSEIKDTQKRTQEALALKNDLEWQAEELKFYKSEAKHRRDSKISKESILESEILNLREKRVSIAQGFEDLEKRQERFDWQKEKISKILVNLQHFCENFGKTEVTSESPAKLKLEISSLESQLKELEQRSKKAHSEDCLHLQINRLKTKISSLKSISAISATMTSTNSARSIMKNFSKVYSVSRITSKPGLNNFVSPGPSLLTRNTKEKQISTLIKNDRSLSVTQRISLQRKVEENNVEVESCVGQQQNKVMQKELVENFKIFKGDVGSIGEGIEKRRHSIEEMGTLETLDNFHGDKWGGEDKAVEDRWKFVEKLEEFKEMLGKSLCEIIG